MDILTHFYNEIGFIPNEISRIAIGEKYVGVKLKNGQIGVCSCLGDKFDKSLASIHNIELSELSNRVIYQAYLNANLNYQNSYSEDDIFDKIDFKNYQNILMIGYFKSLVKKFEKTGISIKISDLFYKGEGLVPLEKQAEFVKQSDAVILTSTSVFNNTFANIVENITNADVFLLGPSGILNSYLFTFKGIKVIFGSIFKLNDDEVLNIIDEGGGTKSFMHLMQKVYLTK